MKDKTSIINNDQNWLNLLELVKTEGVSNPETDLEDIACRLYQSLYTCKDYHISDSQTSKKNLKKLIIYYIHRIWCYLARPYINYNNRLNAILVNIIFIQNKRIKDIETKLKELN